MWPLIEGPAASGSLLRVVQDGGVGDLSLAQAQQGVGQGHAVTPGAGVAHVAVDGDGAEPGRGAKGRILVGQGVSRPRQDKEYRADPSAEESKALQRVPPSILTRLQRWVDLQVADPPNRRSVVH